MSLFGQPQSIQLTRNCIIHQSSLSYGLVKFGGFLAHDNEGECVYVNIRHCTVETTPCCLKPQTIGS